MHVPDEPGLRHYSIRRFGQDIVLVRPRILFGRGIVRPSNPRPWQSSSFNGNIMVAPARTNPPYGSPLPSPQCFGRLCSVCCAHWSGDRPDSLGASPTRHGYHSLGALWTTDRASHRVRPVSGSAWLLLPASALTKFVLCIIARFLVLFVLLCLKKNHSRWYHCWFGAEFPNFSSSLFLRSCRTWIHFAGLDTVGHGSQSQSVVRTWSNLSVWGQGRRRSQGEAVLCADNITAIVNNLGDLVFRKQAFEQYSTVWGGNERDTDLSVSVYVCVCMCVFVFVRTLAQFSPNVSAQVLQALLQ